MNVVDYFQSYENYFWLWEDGSEVVSIDGGSTIAYRQQVAEILQSIAVYGLPPFGSFLLTMISTNKTMDDDLSFVEKKISIYLAENKMNAYIQTEDFINAFIFLRNLNAIPDNHKAGSKRAVLLTTILSNCHNRIDSKTSMGLANFLHHNVKGRTRFLQRKRFNYSVFYKDMQVLGLLHREYPTTQDILEALRALPEIEADEIPDVEVQTVSDKVYKDFADELTDNPYTFQLGSLIKPIWAGFKLPIFNAHPSEQPIGGVSDLSNKGNFDKLLISEFANDDLVFLSRLANNEALYLHREMPPVTDKLQRVLLIDVSLKMWGTPKILAFATWLAIHKHPKSQSSCEAFAVGAQYIPVSGNAVHEVIDSLQNVDVSLHSGEGLRQFLKVHKANRQLEIFFITTEENRKQAELQTILFENQTLFKYLITCEADGHIFFYQHKNNAFKLLQSISLPLEKLWKKKEIKPLTKTITHRQLHFNMLLLIPTPIDIKATFTIDDDMYCVSKRVLIKRSIVHNQKTNKGWEIMLTNVTINGFYEMGKTVDGNILFLAFNPENREISIHNLNTLKVLYTSFPEWKSDGRREFVFHQNSFFKIVRRVGYEIRLNQNQIEVHKADLQLPIYDIYEKREKEISRISKPPSYVNIFKNIMSIYINAENALVFNTHQLTKNELGKYVLLKQSDSGIKQKEAKYNKSDSCFEFDEGSTITVNPYGFITMCSKSETVPTIYITSILDYPLGMATTKHFAGDEFYYHENLSNVGVNIGRVGPHKLEVIKALRTYTDLGLKDAKDIVDSAPAPVSNGIHFQKATLLIEALEALGCEAEILSAHNIKQEIISPVVFYDQYIHNFINQIIRP